jgi:hypothetical protein
MSRLRVQAHTSNLANCVFLPPGSAVVELIQRFWTWMDLDKSFKDQTDRLGDVHHFAWRAHHANQTIYLDTRNEERCALPGSDRATLATRNCAHVDCTRCATSTFAKSALSLCW